MDRESKHQEFIFDWEILLEADLQSSDKKKIHAKFTKVYLDDTEKWTSEFDNKLGELKIADSPSTTSERSELDFPCYNNDRSEENKSSEEEYIDPDAADKIAMGLPSSFGAPTKPTGKRRRNAPKEKRKDLDFDTYWKTFGKMFVNGVEELVNLGPEADVNKTNFANALNSAVNRCLDLLKDHRKIEYFRDFVFGRGEPLDGRGDGPSSSPRTPEEVKELIGRDITNVTLLQSRNRAEMFSKKLHQFSYVSGFNIGAKNKDGVFERPKTGEEVLDPFKSVKFTQHEPVFFGKLKRKNYSLHSNDIDLDAPGGTETVSAKKNETDLKNFDFSFDPVRDAKLIAKNAITIFGTNHKLLKYWHQRYRLFSKLNDGILMDEEGWFSVTPELIAEHIADRMVQRKNCVILDAFTGVGGNAIQFARRGALVYAIDMDPIKLRCARQNAKVYGVEDRITFICGNFYHIAKSFCQSRQSRPNGGMLPIDNIFLSPPWGGPEYLHQQVFELNSCVPDGFDIFRVALKISQNIAYFLPRNTSSKQLLEIAGDTDSHKVEVEHNVLNNKIKALTAYYGNLVCSQ